MPVKEKVTKISIIVPRTTETNVVGWATFVYDNAFKFSDIPIIALQHGGYELDYPILGEGHDSPCVACPINKQVARAIQETVIDKYEEVLAKADANNEA